MKPGRYDLEINQGSTFSQTITVSQSDLDLSTYAGVRMTIKENVEDEVALWDSTTTPGSLVISGQTIVLTIPAATTALFTKSGGYDMELYKNDGTVDKILTGSVLLIKEYTK